jgi:ATP-dependent Clp protease adapter protein ClpS
MAGPGLLERPAVLDRPSVLERPETERVVDKNPIKERKGMGDEAWEVRIYNDGQNTREHVARSLVQITGLTEMQAYQTMMRAHQNGMAVVGIWVYEVAEMYAEGLKKNGIVADMVPVEEDK